MPEAASMNRLLSLTIMVLFNFPLCFNAGTGSRKWKLSHGNDMREEGVDNEPVRRINLNYDYFIGKREVATSTSSIPSVKKQEETFLTIPDGKRLQTSNQRKLVGTR